MKLSASNIAWEAAQDDAIIALMKELGYAGIEIAPTRIIPDNPYGKPEIAAEWAAEMKRTHHLDVSSMQSIWFGRQERIFGDDEEKKILLDYTRKAIDFATVLRCGNLVFGCPRNRNVPKKTDPASAIPLFKELGDYAYYRGTVFALEANPIIYHTNFVNDTEEAFRVIDAVNSPGFLLNLDIGTMIQNQENVSIVCGRVNKINHVHISEPFLKPIKKREIHRKIKSLLLSEDYAGYISVEMGKTDYNSLKESLEYVRDVFSDET